MIKKRLLVNELFLVKKACLTLSEIHNLILQDLDSQESQWQVGPIVKVCAPLYIEVASLPSDLSKTLKSSYNESRQEFVITDLSELPPNKLLLQLKLKWKFEENCSNILSEEILNYCRTKDEMIGIQKKIQIFQYVSDLIDRGEYMIKEIYEALINIDITYYKNPISFGKKLKQFRSDQFGTFLHKRRNRSNSWKKKISKAHRAKVLQLHRLNYDTLQIEQDLHTHCEKFGLEYISRSSIKRIINTPRNKVVQGLQRNGREFIVDNVMSYVDMEKPRYKFQVLECDGSRLQLPYRKTDQSKWKIGYLTIYVIMDIASCKILGYWIDEFENKDMVLMAFYMMLSKYNHLPAYIRIDRSKPHRSKKFKRFLRIAKKLGNMEYRMCYHPREKSTVENFFHWFPEKICKMHPIYTGLGPLVKDWDKKPNPATILNIQNSPDLPTRNELEYNIPKLIEDWNNRLISGVNKDPNSIHALLKIKSAKFMQEHQMAFLTWNKEDKDSFKRNTILKIVDGEKRSYKLHKYDNIVNNFNEPYQIFWLKTEPEFVYVFTSNGKFVEKAKRKSKYLDDPINISEPMRDNLIKERKHNNGLLKYCRDQVKKDNMDLLDKSRTKSPFSIASGHNTDKESASQITDEFLLRHLSTKNSISKSKSKVNKAESNFDLPPVRTKIKKRINKIYDIEIHDLD